MLDLSYVYLQSTTEKLAAGSDGCRPDQRSHCIEHDELFDRYPAHKAKIT
jgi:hypothetical protein